jgi:LuxR family maltose regulon positive regulatory protein
LERPLCLVVGPAGCGKTVVLAQWLAQHPQVATVWLTLEPSDNDPVRFARRLLGGLATIDPALTSLITLVSQLGEGLGRPFVEALGTELASFPEVVVVLDDVQLLSSTTLQADVGELVDVLPPSVHLVLASRVDVPMAWARHRLRHDMVELRQADLAFDDAEAAELVERITGLRLAADGVGALVERTEGWAAGLQLAAITLRDRSTLGSSSPPSAATTG